MPWPPPNLRPNLPPPLQSVPQAASVLIGRSDDGIAPLPPPLPPPLVPPPLPESSPAEGDDDDVIELEIDGPAAAAAWPLEWNVSLTRGDILEVSRASRPVLIRC